MKFDGPFNQSTRKPTGTGTRSAGAVLALYSSAHPKLAAFYIARPPPPLLEKRPESFQAINIWARLRACVRCACWTFRDERLYCLCGQTGAQSTLSEPAAKHPCPAVRGKGIHQGGGGRKEYVEVRKGGGGRFHETFVCTYLLRLQGSPHNPPCLQAKERGEGN